MHPGLAASISREIHTGKASVWNIG